MRKRLVIAGALLLLVVATALVAANFMGGEGKSDGMVAGHKWAYESTFQGRVTCLGPDGAPSTSMGIVTLSGDPSNGEVKLTVDGSEYTFKGVGKHEVRCAHTGQLYGYVVMSPASSDEELENAWGQGVSGQRGTATGAEGYDKTLGYSWELRGAAKVSIERAADGGWKSGGTVESRPNNAPSVPELTIDTKLGKIAKQGFGTYEIPGEDGKSVARLIIEPTSVSK